MAQQQQGNADNALDFLWMIVIFVVIIGLIWYFGKSYITHFIFGLRYYELSVVNAVMNAWASFLSILPFSVAPPNTYALSQWLAYIQSKPVDVSFQTLTDVSIVAGQYLRYPVGLILVVCAFLLYFSNARAKFKTVFNMQRLKNFELKNYPQIMPVSKIDLVKQDLDEGHFAMSLPPMQFAKKNQLLKSEPPKNGQPMVSLISGKAHQLLALQVGPLWQSLEKLPLYTQALFAIFAARGNRDREGANALLAQIAASSLNEKPNFTGTRELLAKNCSVKAVQRIVGSHGYVYTVMASMLEFARTDGVLATAEFLWLKPIDRKLWYMLNSVGRQLAVAEISGAYAHWLAEKKMGRPLKTPMVDTAVIALDIALKEIIYEPDEE